MKIIQSKNYKEMSEKASEILFKEISKNPSLTLCLATGKTPLGLYKLLVKKYKERKLDFSKIKILNLDEYYLIRKSDRRSFYFYLHKNFIDRVNVKKENVFLINGETKNSEKECRNYEGKIKENPIDVAILGLGKNGHIAFNEPGSKINSKTRVVKLTDETIKTNSKFLRRVPDKAITTGIKTILSSKKIILLVSGKEKSKAFNHLLNGKISEKYPVSFLRGHKNLIVIINKKVRTK